MKLFLTVAKKFIINPWWEAQFYNADRKPGSIWPHVYYGAFCPLY